MPKNNIITSRDEGKYRFLKDYFQKNNNHHKELEYFKFEMLARQKGIKQPLEKALFWLYEKVSDYGLSITKPIFWLFISFLIFSWATLDYNKIIIDDWKDVYNLANFKISFVRTIFPLINLETFGLQKELLNTYTQVFQAVINISLLFLLILGIRNKFKIK